MAAPAPIEVDARPLLRRARLEETAWSRHAYSVAY